MSEGQTNGRSRDAAQRSTVRRSLERLRPRYEPAMATAALLLHALLVDAAVETVLRGGGARWWVAAAVALFLGLSVYFRERTGWAVKAALATLALLGTAALAAAWPGGFADGIALLGQPTPVVLSAVSALAVGAAGVVLARTPALPRWGRATVIALAAYGVGAFALAAVRGTSYPGLFDGAGEWTRLPFWLQGTFLGALVVVPAAILREVVRGALHARGRRLRAVGFRVAALALPALVAALGMRADGVAVDGGRAPHGGLAEGGGGGMQPSRPIADSPEEVAAAADTAANTVLRYARALAEARREIPRRTFDPEAVVDAVGRDPVALFEWVRDETVLVPYRGVLRGATGVLMDRRGNSLDRALLLHALLRAAGHDADALRLARGRLDEANAAALMDGLRPPRAANAPADAAADETMERLERYARRYDLDASRLGTWYEESERRERARVDAARERVSDQSARLAALVGEPATETPAAESDRRRRALRDHWWVQWRDGSEWVGLDPTTADARPGEPMAEAEATTRPGDLREELWHRVELRIVVEHAEDGALHEAVALSEPLVPARLIGERVVLRHMPVNWPDSAGLETAADPERRLLEIVREQDRWLPILMVGDRASAQSAFDARGDLISAADLSIGGLGTGTGQKVEDVTDVLGGLPSGPGAEEESEASSLPDRLTAEWIEYEIQSPGRPPRVIRRAIFDLVGPAARSDSATPPAVDEDQRHAWRLALMGKSQILVQVSDLSPAFLEDHAARVVIANAPALADLLRAADSLSFSTIGERAGRLEPLPGPPSLLAVARRTWRPSADDVYIERPNIIAYHEQHRLDEEGGLRSLRGFDIVANEVAVHRDAPASPFRLRLEQGVLDTNAEAVLAQAYCEASEQPAECDAVTGAAAYFAAAEARGIDWRTVRDPGLTELPADGLPADARRRIERAVAAGYAAVAPETALPLAGAGGVAWWRVDPATGSTLGIGGRGWGQEFVEYLVLNAINIYGAYICMKSTDPTNVGKIGCAVGAWMGFMGAAGALAGLSKVSMALVGAATTGLYSLPVWFEE